MAAGVLGPRWRAWAAVGVAATAFVVVCAMREFAVALYAQIALVLAAGLLVASIFVGEPDR